MTSPEKPRRVSARKLASAIRARAEAPQKKARGQSPPSQQLAPSTVVGTMGMLSRPFPNAMRRGGGPVLPPAEHTPGPWRIYGLKDMTERGIDDLMVVASQIGPEDGDGSYGAFITNVGPTRGLVYGEPKLMAVNLANARLIAAAPDLLKAAVEGANALAREARGSPGARAAKQLRAAITRATKGTKS